MRSSWNPPSSGRAWETYKDMFKWGIEPDVMVYTTIMKVSYDWSLCSSNPKILTRFGFCRQQESIEVGNGVEGPEGLDAKARTTTHGSKR